MDDIVAVAIDLENGERKYVLTWGRVFDPVDPKRIQRTVLKFASSFDLGSRPLRATVCHSLQEASHSRYFYEAYYQMISTKMQSHELEHKNWVTIMTKALIRGEQLYYCGK